MGTEEIKVARFTVTKSMCKKVSPVIKEGDDIIVSLSSKDIPRHGEYVLISWNEYQWIQRYWRGLKKKYSNIYLITKIIMNS
jgi:hypothetical protein